MVSWALGGMCAWWYVRLVVCAPGALDGFLCAWFLGRLVRMVSWALGAHGFLGAWYLGRMVV